ncbi:lipopolysaccharide assembly LapA domain-containing protein [Comamonas nitrativorans]|uniref:Lipopolysaccharide assembly LapA domain-containing protein n=1 Tax=Comamonas nitrativorans TaxID=108437 RepID=A0ABV9H1K2_9BURK
MKYLVWLLKAAIFFTLFAFALNNQHIAVVHWFFGQQWSAPLVLIVLAAFCLGLVTGILVMLPRWWQARQQANAAATTPAATANEATASPLPVPLHEL